MLNNCKNRHISVISYSVGAFNSWWINNRRADDQGPCIYDRTFIKMIPNNRTKIVCLGGWDTLTSMLLIESFSKLIADIKVIN